MNENKIPELAQAIKTTRLQKRLNPARTSRQS